MIKKCKMSLLAVIRENKNIRKIFGKKELEIIEKQILGINLLPSEKTRLSRDIKKKLKAVQELAGYSNEFELKKASIVKEMIEEAKEAIFESKQLSRIRRIILFGSYAENQATFRSDIDIAVEFSEIGDRESTEFRIRVMSKLPEKLDIQVYNTLPEKIRKEIDKKGKVLWKKE